MSAPPRGFDRIARAYRWMEYLSFGRSLERARFSLLPRLSDCHRILLVGDGDGRCLARLAALAPRAVFHSIDSSGAMLKLARQRLHTHAHSVTFEQADLLTTEPPQNTYDAVVSCFFIDCFTMNEAAKVVTCINRALTPGALWLWADYALPTKGWRRLRAHVWLALLYRFFHWETGVAATTLPAAETLIEDAGFRPLESKTWQWGMLRSTLFRRKDAPKESPSSKHNPNSNPCGKPPS